MKTSTRICRHHFIEASFALRRAADEPRADRLNIVVRGAGFMTDCFARLANDKCLRTGNRPLLLLNSAATRNYRKILVATDFSETSRQAASIAIRTFLDAQIVFLHAFHLPDQTALRGTCGSLDSPGRNQLRALRARERAVTELDRFVDALNVERQLIARVARPGPPMRTIRNYARVMGADLIAIGNPAQSRLDRLLHGSATRRLMDETGCDLLIAPARTH